jgi:hypothetical protein
MRLIGTVKLPEDKTAPEGGIIGDINGNRFYIPEGKNSVFFISHIDRTTEKPYISMRISRDPKGIYVKQLYYSGDSTEIGIHNAKALNPKI